MSKQEFFKREKVKKILDKKFIFNFFKKNILPKYHKKISLKDVKIKIAKGAILTKSYHLVIKYILKTNQRQKIIYCHTSSSKNKKYYFDVLNYIIKRGFPLEKYNLPQPIIYNSDINAFFYKAVPGTSLLNLIKTKNKKNNLSKIVKDAGSMIAHIHQIPLPQKIDFNQYNNRISNTIPTGLSYVETIRNRAPEHLAEIQRMLEKLIKIEKNNLKKLKKLWFVHGDFHPDNIIIDIKNNNQLGMIDLSDIADSDFCKDLGNFLQQLSYMTRSYLSKKDINNLQKEFLQEYFKIRKIKFTKNIKQRIRLYETWTGLRSVIYFLTLDKNKINKPRAKKLLSEIKNNYFCDL